MLPVKQRRKAAKIRKKHPITDGIDDTSIDWFCNLPQPIIHQILSRLLPLDVIKTCLLSKTLQSAHNSFPVIDLDSSWFGADLNGGEFVKYLSNRIQRLKLDGAPLRKLRIRADIKDTKHANDIKKGIQFAIRNGVQELDIDMVRPRFSPPLPIIKSATSLVSLNLAGLKLYNLNGYDMSSCWPILENLHISCCKGLKKFEFYSTRIRSIALRLDDGILTSVKIQSRSLQKFECAKLDVKSNFSPCLIDISECPFLKILFLSCVHLVHYWVEANVPKLTHLEYLHLNNVGYDAMRVLSSENLKKFVWIGSHRPIEIQAPNLDSLTVNVSNSIKTILFEPCRKLKHVSCEADDIRMEHLKQYLSYMDGFEYLELKFNYHCTLGMFEISCHKRRNSGLCNDAENLLELKIHFKTPASYMYNQSLLLHYITNSSGRLLDVTLSIDSDSPLDKQYLVALWNWIACFGRVKVLTLCCSSLQDFDFAKHLRMDSLSPIYDLKYLTIKVAARQDISSKLVDCFLWQSPNLETLRFLSNECEERSLEFEYGSRNVTSDEPACCKRLTIRCWKHSMMKVFLNNFSDVERDELVKYFSDNATSPDVIVDQRH